MASAASLEVHIVLEVNNLYNLIKININTNVLSELILEKRVEPISSLLSRVNL